MSDTNQAGPEVAAEAPVAPEVAAEAPVAPEVVAEAPVAPEVVAEAPVAPEVVAEAPVAPPPTTTVNDNVQARQVVSVPRQGPGYVVRAIWFVLVGWWLTAIVIVVAYALALSILGLPFAFYLFNRVPAFLTLRVRNKTYQVETSADGTRLLTAANLDQRPMLIRAIWFILIGFWFGAIWMALAYALCVLIVTMPFGLAMFNRVGAVMTLLRY